MHYKCNDTECFCMDPGDCTNEVSNESCGPDISNVVNNNPVCPIHHIPMVLQDDEDVSGHYNCVQCDEEDSQD